MTEEDLLSDISNALAAGSYKNDVRLAAIISLGLSELLSHVDNDQKEAIAVAQNYWNGTQGDADRLASVHKIAQKRDKYIRAGQARSIESYANRIIWAALNTNTPISEFFCEFIIEHALESGIPLSEVKKVS